MTLYEVLQSTGLPCAYSHFKDKKTAPKSPPYLIYTGNGQADFAADDTYYHRRGTYTIEYYFTKKDESKEAELEDKLLENDLLYDKSGDIYIEEEDVYVIYYYV